MKRALISLIASCSIMLSCNNEDALPKKNNTERKVQFNLYTTNDFINNNDSIFFL